jgi:hypothetical protein
MIALKWAFLILGYFNERDTYGARRYADVSTHRIW